ncbi:MAG TPA: TonB-dependent receptor, partial [Puia sp.]|nr:TonB-dependent receptor [Puia sp.]
MKTKIIYFLPLLFSLTKHANAQSTGSIKGTIIDNGKMPLSQVSIILDKTNFRTITNDKGEYMIGSIPTGRYHLVISHVSYQSVKRDIVVKMNETVDYSYTLQASTTEIPSVDVYGQGRFTKVALLPEIVGTNIYSGKKNEVLLVDSISADLAQNIARDVFARVPGITSWELDGSGTQTSVAARGLSPHRSWEFNVNQNGYNVNNDLYGYPEAMYNPPYEAVQEIQIVRGGAALQYGPQFGGMLNYVIRKPDTTKVFGFETQQTFASFSTFNSYNAIGGGKGKFNYYGY